MTGFVGNVSRSKLMSSPVTALGGTRFLLESLTPQLKNEIIKIPNIENRITEIINGCAEFLRYTLQSADQKDEQEKARLQSSWSSDTVNLSWKIDELNRKKNWFLEKGPACSELNRYISALSLQTAALILPQQKEEILKLYNETFDDNFKEKWAEELKSDSKIYLDAYEKNKK
ncbi:MAG: hypothetical protein V4691_04620 [Pseudomonadota bacterium]